MPEQVQQVRPMGWSDAITGMDGFAANNDKTHKFLTTRRYPIYCLSITKCGCTFLKNLFYYLDNDRLHRRAAFIHDHPEDLTRAGDVPPWMIRKSRNVFTVLRRPSHRFLSMYFDKIHGTGPQNFSTLRHEIAAECGLDLRQNIDAAAHRDNCKKLIEWIARNLNDETDIPINAHWRPQSWRIETVEHFGLGTFTLDGLDWQLPAYFGDLIPDLQAKMAAVRARNVTPYPVPKDAVLDAALETAINAVYAGDLRRYERTRTGWEKRRLRPVPAPAVRTDPTINVLGTHRFNLNVITQPKAGCSYVRNVVYALDHGRAHSNPQVVEADGCLVYAERSKRDLATGTNVIVLRDPVKRFFSLYFDKIWGEGQSAFPWVTRKLLLNRGFSTRRDLSLEEHRENLLRLLRYVRGRIDKLPLEEQNPHWRPQYHRARRAREFGFVPILLEDFGNQIEVAANGRIRGLPDALSKVNFRNVSEKPFSVDELADESLLDRLRDLYRRDFALYERARDGWATHGAPPPL